MSDKFVAEHYQKHVITEIEHFPGHDGRTETLEFRNAKHELESVEHLGCFICGSMDKRESHHIYERAYWNGFDVSKVAFFLFTHFDFHGHCKRDFKTWEELRDYFMNHFNGRIEKVKLEDGSIVDASVCDDDAADTIYNQLILDAEHHRGMGTGAHGTTTPTFFAWMAHKPGYAVSIDPKAYEQLLQTHHDAKYGAKEV